MNIKQPIVEAITKLEAALDALNNLQSETDKIRDAQDRLRDTLEITLEELKFHLGEIEGEQFLASIPIQGT